MPDKKPKAKKPKNYAKLSQKQKFIEVAKAAEVDESGETFERALDKIAPPRDTASAAREQAANSIKHSS